MSLVGVGMWTWVASYMLKSDMGNGFIRAVELIDSYWHVVEFPEPNFEPVEPATA